MKKAAPSVSQEAKITIKESRFNFNKKNRRLIIIFVVLLLAALPSYYFFNKYQKAQSLLQNPTAKSAAEAKALVETVGKLIELPVNESPTVATVSDKTKLENQAFFAKAENGDKVLIYSDAKKAILYRPSINKIIEVAPINLGSNPNPLATPAPLASQQPTPTPSVTPQPKVLRVAIYNGTKVTGLAGNAATKLTTKLNNIEVVKKGDAVNDYQITLVIDLTGSNTQLSQFTAVVGGKSQTTVPSGEVKPDADILIILGHDFASQ